MPESRFPKSLSAKNQKPLPQLVGYVRPGPHLTTEWSFELLDDEAGVAIVKIATADGPVEVGMNRSAATELIQKLQLFLAVWPRDQKHS